MLRDVLQMEFVTLGFKALHKISSDLNIFTKMTFPIWEVKQ